MNWSRGLFRLWIIASALWGLSIGTIALELLAEDWLGWVALVAIPPIVVFAVGWALLWAFSGFKKGG